MIHFKPAETERELLGILSLQKENLPQNISQAEKAAQGFVTVNHSFEQLAEMNAIAPHLIAKDGEKVVGYILAMTKASKDLIPVLIPMFQQFERLEFAGNNVASYNYLVIGQICVSKDYRGRGIFDRMYEAYVDFFSTRFDFAITEIADSNIRSIKAHQRVGFEVIHKFSDSTEDWSIVALNWKNQKSRSDKDSLDWGKK
ncbi:GNAT family N-acetyltransferase [Algoriphagus aestuariicola]|uniref:GNAT family N-acetyltransferase n=1 Tax=Algoriphagus aestuariicola TaxID=1852016 RepID=A0ABS3BW47_9BACT|nr:GNAT family N-acetyltransferase [Algoriphagus aestuariicola]MBN7803285.1 GNAT family N-acetyltransferase [Algoriphagus aestuariicola]